MYIIGERINGMFKNVRSAIEEKNKQVIQDVAREQIDGCASALDVNVGPAKVDTVEALKWLVDTIREVTQITLCIDNPKLSVQKEVVPMVGENCIINSSKADPEILTEFLGLATDNDAGLIALTIDKDGVPSDVEKRVELGANIIAMSMDAGLPIEKLFIDPIILPANVAPQQPLIVIETIKQLIMFSDPPPHINLGLSNLSQNCANRELINRTYIAMAVMSGMDAAILDPNDTDLVDSMITTELLTEKTIYCDSFLEAYRMANRVKN